MSIYSVKAFSESSINNLSIAIDAYLAANPSFGAVDVTNTVEGAGFYALLLYNSSPGTGFVTSITATAPLTANGVSGTPESGAVTLALTTPLAVQYGGTGDASFTAYAPIFGGTTSTGVLQSAAGLGTAGQVLTSNGAGAIASFQSVTEPAIIPWTIAPPGAYAIPINSGTWANNSQTLSLPVTPANATIAKIVVIGAALTVVVSGNGATIQLSGGTAAQATQTSTSQQGGSMDLVYSTTGNIWYALSTSRTWT